MPRRCAICTWCLTSTDLSFPQLDVAFKDALKDVNRKRQELTKHEEVLLKKKKEAEKHAAKVKASSNGNVSSASTRETELQEEVDKCMVRDLQEASPFGERLTPFSEHSEVLNMQNEHAQHRSYEVHALYVISSLSLILVANLATYSILQKLRQRADTKPTTQMSRVQPSLFARRGSAAVFPIGSCSVLDTAYRPDIVALSCCLLVFSIYILLVLLFPRSLAVLYGVYLSGNFALPRPEFKGVRMLLPCVKSLLNDGYEHVARS